MNTKICMTCGRELPLNAFKPTPRTADHLARNCRECCAKRKADKITKGGGNPQLADFKSRELIEELRCRGYRGTLEYVNTITL